MEKKYHRAALGLLILTGMAAAFAVPKAGLPGQIRAYGAADGSRIENSDNKTGRATGKWHLTAEGSWQYERPDGSFPKNSWEDIEGELYYFGPGSVMETGWNKINNIWYNLGTDGRLVKGWSCRTEDGREDWYYFDENGRAVIQWQEIDGSRYWFSPEGVMNASSALTIGGNTYLFHPDGRLKCNEYLGGSYLDMEGLKNPEYDILVLDSSNQPVLADDETVNLAAEAVNRVPFGWRKKFLDNGWRFVYCPDGVVYTSARFTDGTGRYPICYRLDTANRLLYFSNPEAFSMAFGEYIYRTETALLRERGYWQDAKWRTDQIMSRTGLPQTYAENPGKVFGAFFAEYVEKSRWETLKADKELSYICRLTEEIAENRRNDGLRKE